MPMSSKFLTESTGEKIVKIGQYLAKIWTKNDSLVFLGHPVHCTVYTVIYKIGTSLLVLIITCANMDFN